MPTSLLKDQLAHVATAMKTLDLHQLIIFDASNTHGEHTVTGKGKLEPTIHRQTIFLVYSSFPRILILSNLFLLLRKYKSSRRGCKNLSRVFA